MTRAERIDEYYNPYYQWDTEETSAILTVILSGYRKRHLQIELTSTPPVVLMIKGERQITENRWLCFNREIPIPSNYDTENLTAKLEGGLLYLKFPTVKGPVLSPKETTTLPSPQEFPRAHSPTAQRAAAPSQKPGQEVEGKAEKSTSEISENTSQKEKEPSHEKEKTKTETEASNDNVANKELKTNDGLTDQTTDADAATATSKVPEMNGAKILTGSTMCNWVGVILLVLVLWLYVRNAFRSSLEASKLQEL